MRVLLRVALVLAAAVLGPAQAADLEEPAPIPVPQLAPELVEKAIRLACAERGWTVAPGEAGALVADYAKRSHLARIRIAFDATQVTIRYLESLNLDYEQDGAQRTIHRSYNGWVNALAEGIARQLQRADLSTVAAPVDPASVPRVNPLAPPPSETFDHFSRIELVPTILPPEFRDGGLNERAAAAIDTKLRARLESELKLWNAQAEGGRTLRIEPHVADLRLVPAGVRGMASGVGIVGLIAGDSFITLRVRYVDAGTGAIVAEPLFKGGEQGAAEDRVMRDSGMLEVVARAAAEYTVANYAVAEQPQAPAGPARILEPTDTVTVRARYGDGVGSEALRSECAWLLDLPAYIGKFARSRVVAAASDGAGAGGLDLDIVVTGVRATGGRAWGGTKHARMRGELRDGGKLVGSFEAQRRSNSGHSACGAADNLAEVIARDIAAWLQRPTLNALLGDLRSRR